MEHKIPRINSNTQTLQKHFPEVYGDLFAESHLVLSASASFYWAGEFSVLYGGPAIMQKLPLRSYTGLEFTDKPTIEPGPWLAYEPHLQRFEDKDFFPHLFPRLIDFLEKEFLGIKNKLSHGIKIYSIDETPPNRGFNSSGAFAASIAAALHIWVKDIKTKDIERWRDYATTKELLADKLFRKVATTAWKIENITQGDTASGVSWVAASIYSKYPIFFMTEYRIGNWDDYGQANFPAHPANKYEIFNKITFTARRLDEIFPIKEHFGFPIDYGLIFTGEMKDIMALKVIHKINNLMLKNITVFTKEKLIPHLEDLASSPLRDAIKEQGWEAIWHLGITGPLTVTTLRILDALRKFFNDEYWEETLKDFMRNLRSYNMWLYSLGPIGEGISPIMRAFRQLVNKKDSDYFQCGTKSVGTGRVGGDFLFAVPCGVLRERADEIIRKLRTDFSNDKIALDYASWLDGHGTEGLKVEQHVPDGSYSRFVSPDSIRVVQFGANGPKSFLAKRKECRQLITQSELTVDLTDEKIFIRGRVPSSKELPSSSTTAIVLGKLLQSPDFVIKNSDLPRSSYANNRNELQSKILTPLNKLLEKELGKTLSLEIHGHYSDFYISLSFTDPIQITLIKKVF